MRSATNNRPSMRTRCRKLMLYDKGTDMTTDHKGVTAAPNRCEIKLRIVSVTHSDRFPDKQELVFEVLAVQPIEGPDFATQRIGQSVNGFTFDTPVTLAEGALVTAEAEYVGGARQGSYQLFNLRATEP